MVDPAAMAVDGGNADGEARVAHSGVGEGPDASAPRTWRLRASFCLAAHTAHKWALLRWSMGSWSLLTRVVTTLAPATGLVRTPCVFTCCMRLFPASSACWPSSGHSAILVTTWPRSTRTRSSGTNGRSAISTRSCRLATRLFVTKCFCNSSTVSCTPTICCSPCAGPRHLTRRPTRFVACCGTGRRPSSSSSRWPIISQNRSDTPPVWRSTSISLRWWRQRRTTRSVLTEVLVWARCWTPPGRRFCRQTIVGRRTLGSSAGPGHCWRSGQQDYSVRRGRLTCLVGFRRSPIGSPPRRIRWRPRLWYRTWPTRCVTSTAAPGSSCTPSTPATWLPRGFAPCKRKWSLSVWTRPYHTYTVSRCFYRCKCLNSPTRRPQGSGHPHPNQQLSK